MGCEHGIISVETIEEMIEMKERQLYLNQHQHKIWQGSNDKWYTYLGSGSERKLVKKNTRDDLTNYISSYYKEKADNPTIKELFDKWIEYKLETGEIRRGTYDRYQCDFKRYFLSTTFYLQHIKNITEDELDIFIRQTISRHEITQKAYSNFRTIVIGIFKYAKRSHYTDLSISTFFQDLDISKRVFKPKANNVEDSLIMSQMGHTDIQTTRKYYYFANKDDDYKRKQIDSSIIF